MKRFVKYRHKYGFNDIDYVYFNSKKIMVVYRNGSFRRSFWSVEDARRYVASGQWVECGIVPHKRTKSESIKVGDSVLTKGDGEYLITALPSSNYYTLVSLKLYRGQVMRDEPLKSLQLESIKEYVNNTIGQRFKGVRSC